jgi:hypothetical protein
MYEVKENNINNIDMMLSAAIHRYQYSLVIEPDLRVEIEKIKLLILLVFVFTRQ